VSNRLLLFCLSLSSLSSLFFGVKTLANPPSVATILSLTGGDRACYVELLDTQGETTTELADFSICEQSELINQKVELVYEEANVLAAECQGDVDCGLSDRVMLITSVKPVE